MRDFTKNILLVSIAAVGIILFFPSLNIYFLSDNIAHLEDAAANMTNFAMRYFRPLSIFSLWADFQIWGMDYRGYHLTNMILHLIVTYEVYWLSSLLINSRFFAYTASFLFLLHPIHSLAIFWISGRTDIICSIFYLLTLCSFIQYFRTENLRYYGLAVVGFILALAAKEMAVTTPLVLMLYILIMDTSTWQTKFETTIKMTVVFWGLLVGYLIFRYANIGNTLFANADHHQVDIVTLLKNLVIYLGLLTIPGGHIEIATFLKTHPWLLTLATAFSGVVGLFLLYKMKISRTLLFAVLFLFVTLLPVLRLIMRWYLYLPSVGFCLIAAYFIFRVSLAKSRHYVYAYSLFLLLCWIYAVFIIREQQHWIVAGELSQEYTSEVCKLISEKQLKHCYLLNVPAEFLEIPVNMYGLQSLINFRLKNEYGYEDTVTVKRILYVSMQQKSDMNFWVVRKMKNEMYEVSVSHTGGYFIFPDNLNWRRISFHPGQRLIADSFQLETLDVNNLGLPTSMLVAINDSTRNVIFITLGRVELHQ
jgi:hypothetical protein